MNDGSRKSFLQTVTLALQFPVSAGFEESCRFMNWFQSRVLSWAWLDQMFNSSQSVEKYLACALLFLAGFCSVPIAFVVTPILISIRLTRLVKLDESKRGRFTPTKLCAFFELASWLLPPRARTESFEPAFGDLHRSFVEARQKYKGRWQRRWLTACFCLNALVLMYQSVGTWALAKVLIAFRFIWPLLPW